MGIKHLNRFLNAKCSNTSICTEQIRNFKNKTLVIDTSIYLYKFLGDDTLIEQMYVMITMLLKYNITSIFVFDGKPPNEKKRIINDRRLAKREAEEQYNNISGLLTEISSPEQDKMLLKMETLKKQFIRVKNDDIRNVQTMMNMFNVLYVEASGEADELCAKLCISGLVDGCVSDDMDMFAYGCPVIMRNMNLVKQTVQCYYYKNILTDLNMEPEDLKNILICSKNDYNTNESFDLYETLKWFNEWKKTNQEVDFKLWLHTNTKYINDYEKLLTVYDIFTLSDHIEMNIKNMLSNKNVVVEKTLLKEFLYNHGFIFV
jgi:hypothetical protein